MLPGEGPCVRPNGINLHYEIELALIMGKAVRDLKPDDEQGAMDAIDSEWGGTRKRGGERGGEGDRN